MRNTIGGRLLRKFARHVMGCGEGTYRGQATEEVR